MQAHPEGLSDELDSESEGSKRDYKDRLEALLTQCRSLYSSISEFQSYLASTEKENLVSLNAFRTAVASELKSLNRLSGADHNVTNMEHGLRSTNMPFWIIVWNTARSCKGVTALRRRVYTDTRCSKRASAVKRGVQVDIIANWGLEWVKVSNINERSLLYDLARAGWDSESEDGDAEDGAKVSAEGVDPNNAVTQNGSSGGKDRYDEIDLVKSATELAQIAKTTKVRYQHPSIRIVLPKIIEGAQPVVDRVIRRIRATGAIVECSIPELIEVPKSDDDPNEAIFHRMLNPPLTDLTSSLNLDCTILLALASDLSHMHISAPSHKDGPTCKQVDEEALKPLLPNELYPVLVYRPLFCAGAAAHRMRDIVKTVGTPKEKIRAELLLGEGASADRSGAELREELSKHGEYTIPEGLLLPIHVEEDLTDLTHLPPAAAVLEPKLTTINRSVFFLGWARGWTTVTSNRTVAKQVEQIIEAEEGDVVGPRVWICSTARSLIGKEKRLK